MYSQVQWKGCSNEKDDLVGIRAVTGKPLFNRHHSSAAAIRRAHLWMVVFSIIIAGSFPVVAAITPGMDSTVLTFWRFLAATLIFALMLPFVKENRRPGWKDLGRYAVVGGSYGLFFILMFEALKQTSALNTSVIYTMLPLLTMLLGGLVGEPVRVRQFGVLTLSMAATMWVIFQGDWHRMIAFQLSHGDLIFLLGTLCLAVYMLSMKKLQRDESKVRFTFFSLLTATTALLAAAVYRTGGLAFPGVGIWLGIGYLAGPSTAVTFWILQRTTPRLGPNRVAAYTFLTPSIVAALDWALGLATPDLSVLPGIGMTLLAVWLLQLEAVSGGAQASAKRLHS
jgi:drug/metabolite transporter (DMT)-like permease